MELQIYEDRNFMIFNISELNQINFDEILETSAGTIRISIDGTKTFVKWDGNNIPPSVQTLTTAEGPYTYSEILDIMNTPEWTNPDPIIP